MLSIMGASIIHLLLVWLFVSVLGLGFLGVCLCTCLMFINRFLIALVQIELNPALKNVYDVKLFSAESRQHINN